MLVGISIFRNNPVGAHSVPGVVGGSHTPCHRACEEIAGEGKSFEDGMTENLSAVTFFKTGPETTERCKTESYFPGKSPRLLDETLIMVLTPHVYAICGLLQLPS
jgi:hypothetical protein